MAAKREFNDNDYQEHYRMNYAARGQKTYMQTRSAYQYGWQMAQDRRYAKRDWGRDVESELHWAWNQRGPAMVWEDAKEAIHEGWNRARGIGKPKALGSTTTNVR